MPEGIFEFKGKEVRVGNYGGVAQGLPEIITTPLPNLSGIDGGPGKPLSFEESFKQRYNSAPGGDKIESVSLSSISTDKRYKSVFRGSNPEEMHAQQQAWTEKAYNDTLKFGTLVGTTIAGGFGMVYGAGKWMLPGGKFSDIWANPIMQGLDKINTAVDEALPNYYTEAEKNAEWYSTDNLFTANFLFDKVLKNSGFAVGAMLSGNIASGLLEGAGAGIGSLATRGMANLAKSTTSLGETSTAFKLFTPILRSTARAFSVGENVAAANVLRTQAKSIADIASKTTKLAAIEKEAARFAKFNLAGRRTAIAAYSSAGESSFEALQSSNTFRNKLLNDYFYENGKNAEGDDLAKIDDLSRRVGKMSFLSNMALLTVTEFQQLPYLAGSSFKKSRAAANELLGKVDDAVLKEGKYVSKIAEAAPSTRLGKVFKGVTDTGGALLRGKSTYLFDPKEGLQELLQSAIQVGTENYYNQAYKGKESQGLIDSLADIAGYGLFGRDAKGEGVGALVSKEGLEGAIIGGLTGGPMQAMEVYAERQQLKTHTANFLKELDNSPTLKQAFIDKIDAVNRGVQLQKKHETAVLTNDKLEAVDSMTDLMHNYLAPRIKYGKFDMIMDDLNELKAAAMENNGEGLALLKQQGIGNIDDTIESFTKRISAVQEKAKSIQEMYEYMNLNYAGQTITGADGKEYIKYSPEVIDKMVYATTKIADYDKRLPLLAGNLRSAVPIDAIVAEVLKEGKVDLLNQGLETVRGIDDPVLRKESEQQLLDSVDLGMRRKKFINELNDMIAAPENFKSKPVVNLDDKGNVLDADGKVIPSETITIKAKNSKGVLTDKEIELNTDYIVGKIVEKDKKGREVYRAIRIKVLGKTEDGTKLRILDVATGEESEVSPEKLEDYKLGKASDATPQQLWVARNWNKVFVHKGLKDKNGKFREGRIESHPNENKKYFVYTDEKGKRQQIAVTNDMFSPKEGSKYKEGIIAPRETLSATDQKTFNEIFGEKENITSDGIIERNNYLADLHEKSKQRLEEINNKLEENQKSLEDSAEQLKEKTNDLTYTKKGTLRKSGFAAIQKTINSVKSVIDNLDKQNEELNIEKSELEYTLPFYEEAIDQLSEFPEDNSAILDKMKSQVKLVKDLLSVTDDTIGRTQSLLEDANDLFVKAVKAIESFIEDLKNSNDDLKTIFLDEYQETLERFFGEEGAKQVINDKEGYTRRLLELQGKIAAFTDEMNLPKLKGNIEGLTNDIQDLKDGLEKLSREYAKREEILKGFQTFVDEQEQREKEEALVNNNAKVKKAALNTKDKKTIQTRESNVDYEKAAKKPNSIMARASSGVDRGKPHQTRARNFGVRFPRLSNKNEIRGIYVTTKTEDKLGIPGLVDKLLIDDEGNVAEGYNRDEVIVLVMVNTAGNFVNEFGEEITEGEVVDQAVFQTMPDGKFEWSKEFSEDGKPVSMFRKGTPKEIIDQVKEQYAEERAEILSDDYITQPVSINASFGIPILERNEEGDINYDAKTSLLDSDLIESVEDLENKQVVIVPTKGNEADRGLVSYMNAVGRPFAITENGSVPLQNRQHTKQEAETIYNALVQLAKNMMDPKEGITGSKAVRLLTYLKSVVYWGLPEDSAGNRIKAGYNSIFFEEDKEGNLMLTISNEGFDVKFTPSELERNKGEVIDKILDLYGNVNSSMVRSINSSYEQVTAIAEDGSIESIIWPNYQSYLTSNVMPDANGELVTDGAPRTDAIPLTTLMKPVNRETGETNRTAVYFYRTDNAEDYAFAEIEKRTTTTPKTMTAGKLSTPANEQVVIFNNAKYIIKEDAKGISITTAKGKFVAAKSKLGQDIIAKSKGQEATITEETEITPTSSDKWVFNGETENEIEVDGNLVKFTIDENNDITIIKIEGARELFAKVKGLLDKTKKKKHTVAEVGKVINASIEAQILAALPEKKPAKSTSSRSGGRGYKPSFNKTQTNFSEEENEQEAEEEEEAEREDAKEKKSKPSGRGGYKPNFSQRRGRGKYRRVLSSSIGKVVTENWKDVESFIKANFPNVPIYRVKNILENGNGTRQAWGMFRDGALYLYENAEVGTVYHEVFEGIWEMFTTPRERANLIKEFKSREGSFVDRPTGQSIKYSEAEPEQIREQLAEETRDYFQNGIIPPKPGGKTGIVKFFADLFRMIKNFFTGSKAQSDTERLFEKLGSGNYARKFSAQSNLAYATQGIIDVDNVIFSDEDNLREKLPLSDIVRNEIIQEMTYATLSRIVKDDKSLFEETALNSTDLYNSLFNDVIGLIDQTIELIQQDRENKDISAKEAKQYTKDTEALKNATLDNWETIVKRHKEYLKGYQIEFDENDNIALTDIEKSKDEGYGDATKIDGFKKANRAIKLLLSTLPYIDENGDIAETSIGGARLIPVSKVFVSLLNTVANASTLTQMMEKLRVMAENDANYEILYERLTKRSIKDGPADLSNITTTHSAQLLTAFWKTFKKYNSAVRNVTVLENGEVSVGEAHLSNVANQLRNQYQNNIVVSAKQKKGFFLYDEKAKAYISDSLKAKALRLTTKASLSRFLNEIGVDFSTEELNTLERNFPKEFYKLQDAAFGIKDSLVKGSMIFKINSKYANISGRLLELGYIKAKLSNPDANSTFYNMSGEQTQSYIGPNASSQLFEAVSSLQSLTSEELADLPQYNYLLTDVFTQGSRILKRMFDKKGKRKEDQSGELDDLLQVGYAGGIDNQEKGKQKPSAKLNYRERLIQEINLNLKGWYLNLVPGDSALEHMIKLGNEIKAADLAKGMVDVNKIFRDYFISELNMSREERPIVEIKLSEEDKADGKRQRRTTDLRFFKSILENAEGKTADEKNKLHDEIVAYEGTPEEVYEKYADRINKLLEDYISKDAQYMANALTIYNIARKEGKTITLQNMAFGKSLTEQQFDREMRALSINYMIANIEMHKLLYSDPYQYAEELKRVKSFNSPRQLIVGNDNGMNQTFNNVWNKGFKKGDIGYTDFLGDAFKTVTLKDVVGVIDLKGYSGFKETDGGGVIIQKAHRNFRIRSGEWNDAEERQYRYDVAYEKVVKGEGLTEAEKKKMGFVLTPEEAAFGIKKTTDSDGNVRYLGNNPQVQSAYTNLKPIVAGNKDDGNPYNDIVLDKFALYPLSFRILHELNPNSNAIKMYDKLQKEKVDYAVYDSGRKVGAQNSHAVYDDKGKFNNTPFVAQGEGRNIINVPYSIIAVQSEVPSKEEALTRRGTQITKLITLDYMDAGIPVDFMEDDITDTDDNFTERYKAWYALSEEEKKAASPLYTEIKNNQMLLEAMTEEGVKSLLKSLGIKQTETKNKKGDVIYSYEITDFSKAGKTLREEVLKREVNDNISAALNNFLDNGVALETTPAYQQIRNILYSIADREVISPKISGGMKVQIPSTLLESVRAEKTTINGKEGYTSKDLEFYSITEDGKTVNVCQIMIGRWFKSSLSDKELLKYLNDTEEGQKILSGLAYRIPTQQQNSIDVFKIKQFLPQEFKDSVVIPAALVEKTGSDFDIDKLSMYLKNVFEDIDGKIKMVPYYGVGEEARAKFGKLYDDLIKNKLQKISNSENFRENLFELFDALENNRELTASQKDFYMNLGPVVDEIREQAILKDTTPRDYILNQIVKQGEREEKLTNDLLNEELKQDFIDRKYKQSLENAFIESGENLVSHPKNFDKLVRPNSADELKGLSKFISEKTVGKGFGYTDVGNMLNRRFMSRLRHAFVTGKYAIGIAAVNQTNHSLNQRQLIFVDYSLLKNVSAQDKEWLGDAKIKFDKYNKVEIGGKIVPTLSKVKNAVGKDISNILGQFIDGYVDISAGPWIMELGATPNVASTWMFLAKIGVPIDTVAYFMNQPIIKDYLRSIENDGYSFLFMDTYVKNMIRTYGTLKNNTHHSEEFKAKQKAFKIPSNEELKETVGKKDLTPQEKIQQQHMLIEFLKYAKMGEQLFHVTQGSNFDTSNFNDPYLVFKKQMQLIKAQNTIIASVDNKGKTIPGVDAILNNSFLRNMANSIYNFRDALATVLVSDQKKTRDILQRVLAPHTDLSDNEFIKIAQKVVADFFDYTVQTEGGANALNKSIEKLLVKNQGILPQVLRFIEEVKEDVEHPLHNNQIISILQALPSGEAKADTVNNISVKGTDNKVFDQNNIIYGFREMRDYLKDYGGEDYKDLYNNIVKVSILQSGLSNSKISFSAVLPYEDFQDIYNNVIGTMATRGGLDNFVKLGVFERTNATNDDVVPNKRAGYIASIQVYNPSMYFLADNIKAAVRKGIIPPVLTQSIGDREAKYDYMTYTWEENIPNVAPGLQAKTKAEMRKAGNYSFIKKGLFKKVYDNYGVPLISDYVTSSGELREYFVYKAINAWGDSFRAKEFYNTDRKSVIDNGFIKVNSTEDVAIIAAFNGAGPKELSQITGVKEQTPVTPATLSKEKSSAPTIESTTDIDEYYEPFSYNEDDQYAEYDLNESGKNINKKSVPLQSQKNSPKGLPSIDRTNKKC